VSAPTGNPPHLPVSSDLQITSIGQSTGCLGTTGPVAAELLVETTDPDLGAQVRTTYTLYAELDHLDIVNEVERLDFLRTSADRRYGENAFLAFPFAVADPQFRVEYDQFDWTGDR